MPGGWTCSNGAAQSPLRRASSTSTGSRRTAALREPHAGPFLGAPYGEVLESGDLDTAIRRRRGPLPRAVLRAPLPDRAAALPPHPAGRRAIRSWRDFALRIRPHRPAPARPRRGPGAGRRAARARSPPAPARRKAPPAIAGRWPPTTRPPRPADARCTGCWNASTTAWPGGAPRRTRSTGAASSTSPRSPACGSSCRRCSTPRTSCPAALCRGRWWTACASTMWTAWPTRAAIAASCDRRLQARRGRRARRARVIWVEKILAPFETPAHRLAGGRHHRLRLHGRGRAACCTIRRARRR